MEIFTLLIFCILLFVSLILDIPILFALLGGLILFSSYAIKIGIEKREVVRLAINGVKTVRDILITFALIGSMTSLWRASGVIATIVSNSSSLISPRIFLMMTFLLNALISTLTGTSFGTSATMGVICASMGLSLGVSPVLTGGAVLSGAFVGDRCSAVSTSALLVSHITSTNIYSNIKAMLKSGAVPFVLTALIYLIIGSFSSFEGTLPNLKEMFSSSFNLSLWTLLPAIILMLLVILRVNVKIAMLVSIITAFPIALLIQDASSMKLVKAMLIGYRAENPEIASMLNGGGVLSMLRVALIVAISSSYSLIFQRTGLLNHIKEQILSLADKTTPFFAALITSIITSLIACNQTLSILLTYQICKDTVESKEEIALTLENTAVIVAPLIPWSIAGAVPLETIGAPVISIAFAFYPYLIPIFNLMISRKK